MFLTRTQLLIILSQTVMFLTTMLKMLGLLELWTGRSGMMRLALEKNHSHLMQVVICIIKKQAQAQMAQL